MLRKIVKILLVVVFIITFGIIGSNDYNDRLEELGITKSE
jgi:hypothetical protein